MCLSSQISKFKFFYNVAKEAVFSVFGLEEYSCILKMEVTDSIEALVKIYQTTRLYLAKDKHINNLSPNPHISPENFS